MWLIWGETIKKGEGRGEDDLRKLQWGRAEEQNQYEQFSTPLNEVLSFKGWIVKCSWRTTRNQDKHGVRRRANLKRINFTKHICSREILIRIALDCQVTSSRRHCSRARSKTRRKGCQRLSRAFSTGTILEWQEWQSNISPWKHGYLWRED